MEKSISDLYMEFFGELQEAFRTFIESQQADIERNNQEREKLDNGTT